MRAKSLGVVAAVGCLAWLQAMGAPLRAEDQPGPRTYDDHVQPILRAKCVACHNPNKKSSGLDLTTYANLMQGGAAGEVISPGSASDSYLYSLITHESEPFMPPESPKIPDEDISLIAAWIDGGALENAGSKPMASRKPKPSLALGNVDQARPESPAMPGRLVLDPIVHAQRTTVVPSMATSPWAPLAAIASPRQVLLYNTQTLELMGALAFPEGMPIALRFSRNGQLLLAGGGRGGSSGAVVAWNVETGERVIQAGDELDQVLAADISADQAFVALGGPPRLVRIFSTAEDKLLHELKKHTEWITAIEFSPDGVLLATADRNGGLMVWETHTGREYLTLNGHTAAINAISWRADSNILASASEDGTVRLWEMQNGGQVKNWNAHPGVASVEFARDGRLLTTGRDRSAKLWDQDGKQLAAYDALGDIGVSVTLCDETNRALVADWTGAIHVWNAADGVLVGHISPNPPPLAVRLQIAQTQLAAAQEALPPAVASLEQAAQSLGVAQQNHQEAERAVAANGQHIEQLSGAIELANTNVTAARTLRVQSAKIVDVLSVSVPPLIEAAEKAAQAAQADADESLQMLAAKLDEIAKLKAALLVESQKQLQDADQQIASLDASIKEAEVKLAAARQTQPTLTPVLEQAAAALQPATAAHEQAKAAADAATANVAAAESDVAKWTAAIKFRDLMEQLNQERTTAQLEWESKAKDLAEVEERLSQAQQELAVAMQEHATAVEAEQAAAHGHATAAETVAQTTHRLESLRQQRTDEGQLATRLDQAIQALQSAEASTRQALEKAPEDAELKAVTDSIQALVAQKGEAAKAQAEKIAGVDGQVAQAATDVQAAQASLEMAQVQSDQAKQLVAQKLKALDPFQAAAAQMQQARQAALDATQQASQAVDLVEQKIEQARNS